MKYCQGPKCHEYKTKDRIMKLENVQTFIMEVAIFVRLVVKMIGGLNMERGQSITLVEYKRQ